MKCTVWGIQSVIIQYLCMVTDDSQTFHDDHLKCMEIVKHYVVCQKLTQCCRPIILQKQTNSQKKKLGLWLPEAGGRGREELHEVSHKVETSSYKTNKQQGCNVQHSKYNQHCCMLYMKVVKRVNPKSSHHKENFFFYFFNFMSIGNDGCSLN